MDSCCDRKAAGCCRNDGYSNFCAVAHYHIGILAAFGLGVACAYAYLKR
jgi:hypothetical protein